MSSCKSYLEDGRYTWRHNSVLLHISRTLSSLQDSSLYADLPSFPSPSLITGDSLRPDLVLVLNSATVYLLELTVSFESNMTINSDHIEGISCCILWYIMVYFAYFYALLPDMG